MIVLRCDLCKQAVEDEMLTVEIGTGISGGPPKERLGAHVCPACAKTLDVASFLHKFRSMGAVDVLAAKVAESQQRPQITGPDAPVAVDPRFIKRIQGR